jgi:serine/threonine protein kinase/WD40 repeat protein
VRQDLQSGDPPWIGPYRLEARLGSGGMGRVFLGRSAGRRLVAVKVIRDDLATDPEFRLRFGREVTAAKQVGGLFTALVIDADVEGPMPWLATAYIAGPSLTDAVSEHGPLPPESLLSLAAGLAEGLSAIHAVGLVHRDLKPSNILLADDGPRVIDFGISRATEASVLTRTGMVVGSPGFMSPEQAEGDEVGPASDVFSLGAVLVFAATGTPPFGTGSTAALAYRVVHSRPRLDNVPPEVRFIAEWCLAKNPGERPTPADLLAELGDADLNPAWLPTKVLEGIAQHTPSEPVSTGSSPPPMLTEHESLPSVPEPAPDAPDTVTVAPRYQPAEPPTTKPPPAGSVASPPSPLTPHAPANPISETGARRTGRVQPRRITLIGTTIVLICAVVATVFALTHHAYKHRQVAPQLVHTLTVPNSSGVPVIAYNRSGTILATGDQFYSSIYLWDVATGRRIAALTDNIPDESSGAVAFSANGKTLASGCRCEGTGSPSDNTYLWDIATRHIIATLTNPDSQSVVSVAYSPDGTTLATGDNNGTTYLWDVTTRHIIATLTDPDSGSDIGKIVTIAYSPDGRTLAIAVNGGKTYLWDVATRRIIATLTDPNGAGGAVAYSPDGTELATNCDCDAGNSAGNFAKTYLWDVATRHIIATLTDPHSQGAFGVTFSPNGTTLATSDNNGSIYLWDVASGHQIATFSRANSGGFLAVTYSPDGTTLATGDSNGDAYLWANVSE